MEESRRDGRIVYAKEVTQEHIDRATVYHHMTEEEKREMGGYDWGANCPIATAFKEHFERVHVMTEWMQLTTIGDIGIRFKFSDETLKFVDDVDHDREVKPFLCEIVEYPWSESEGHKEVWDRAWL